MKPAKPRKPTSSRSGWIDMTDLVYRPVFIEGDWYSLKDAKRLHKWLGRAISYLESKGKRR